jgi:MoxR-like ATPase
MQPQSIDDTLQALETHHYIAERGLATSLYLALRLGRPLFLEGEPGVGKTEVVKVLSAMLGTRLIRLQCYEGLDISSAVYERDYARQMQKPISSRCSNLTARSHPARPTRWASRAQVRPEPAVPRGRS